MDQFHGYTDPFAEVDASADAAEAFDRSPQGLTIQPAKRRTELAAAGDLLDRVPAAVVETVARCYRIQDSHDDWSEHMSGRYDGYAQTLALLLGIPTKEIKSLLSRRAL